ncbi:MAG: spermidine synthase [Chromatocurvus sp.]
MQLPFEEVDNQPSPIGDIALRRRRFAALGQRDIYEVKLGDEFLMSSAFVEGEVALADLALAEHGGDALSVVVGGLGLGYTADAALRHAAVRELLVVEYLPAVIRWHEESRVPLGSVLCADERYRAVSGDFFSLAASEEGFDADRPGNCFDIILVDIDHSPRALLAPGSAGFYNRQGLAALRRHLSPGGVFALWSDDSPDADFVARLQAAFASAVAHVVEFDNPFLGVRAANTVYVARNVA